MAVIIGLAGSFTNARNGMTKRDMTTCQSVAAQLDEVIIFRSTGPWARRWIERKHPTKNFHVKGKSSDWGPQAGLVPYDALLSKKPQTADRTKANDKSEHEGWARRVPLVLSRIELLTQIHQREGNEVAIRRVAEAANGDMLLWSGPHPDAKAAHNDFLFRAVKRKGGESYDIMVYMGADNLPDTQAYGANQFLLADSARYTKSLQPLYVMASGEAGAGDKPITGDYDLFAVVPTWAQYGSLSVRGQRKHGIFLEGKGQQRSMHTTYGVGMDNVPDPSLHTMSKAPGRWTGPRTQATQQRLDSLADENPKRREHADMGNVTPRVLQVILTLNVAMGAVGASAPFRRVHHNAENLRNAAFGALSRGDMEDTSKGGGGYGDGFPLTCFLPPRPTLMARYGTTCTLTDHASLSQLINDLHEAGFYVPRNVAWGIASPYFGAAKAGLRERGMR